MMVNRRIQLFVSFLALAFTLSACTSANTSRKKGTGADKTASEDSADAGIGQSTDIVEVGIHHKEFASTPDLASIPFDYDAYALSADARAIATKNATYLKSNQQEVLVEGHCDERGTTEYNLALGQSRANAVRAYYRALGVSSRRLATISYGEERPPCRESTEDCWGRSRRAETLARVAP
jgi:peptidoglycan-associated lipoprotein